MEQTTHKPFSAVADLLWAMGSPPLLSSEHYGTKLVCQAWCENQVQLHQATIRELEKNSRPLIDYLHSFPPTARLGVYFEQLIRYWLERMIQVPQLKANLPIRDDKKTLGELDLVFWDPELDLWRHWEIAVKFYLYRGTADHLDVSKFIGPNEQDRLDLKLKKIFEGQLPLAQLPLTGLKPVKSEAFVRGRLYYPVENWMNHPHPKEISAQHERGWWCHWQGAETLIPKAAQYTILDKTNWISPAAKNSPLLTRDELIVSLARHFESTPEAIQISVVGKSCGFILR